MLLLKNQALRGVFRFRSPTQQAQKSDKIQPRCFGTISHCIDSLTSVDYAFFTFNGLEGL